MDQLEKAQFQEIVAQYLIRHRSIIDVLSKYQEASARVQRAIAKAVTTCGCVEIHGKRQTIPAGTSYGEMKEHMAGHLQGELCDHCREIIENELGRHLFYLTALCEVMGLELSQVVKKELDQIKTLGVYNLT